MLTLVSSPPERWSIIRTERTKEKIMTNSELKIHQEKLRNLKFDHEKIEEQMKIVERENLKIIAGTKVDSSILHLTFDV